jgi:hypothetical protein
VSLERARRDVVHRAVIEHERRLLRRLHRGIGLLDIFAEHRLLALEAHRIHVGEVVRRHVEPAPERLFLAQQHIRGDVHRTVLRNFSLGRNCRVMIL